MFQWIPLILNSSKLYVCCGVMSRLSSTTLAWVVWYIWCNEKLITGGVNLSTALLLMFYKYCKGWKLSLSHVWKSDNVELWCLWLHICIDKNESRGYISGYGKEKREKCKMKKLTGAWLIADGILEGYGSFFLVKRDCVVKYCSRFSLVNCCIFCSDYCVGKSETIPTRPFSLSLL